jgi:hypothetical protein
VADPSFDYSDIMSKLIALLNFCIIDGELQTKMFFTNFSIAIACIYVLIEQLGWSDFLDQLQLYVKDLLKSDDQISLCKEVLEKKLKQEPLEIKIDWNIFYMSQMVKKSDSITDLIIRKIANQQCHREVRGLQLNPV